MGGAIGVPHSEGKLRDVDPAILKCKASTGWRILSK